MSLLSFTVSTRVAKKKCYESIRLAIMSHAVPISLKRYNIWQCLSFVCHHHRRQFLSSLTSINVGGDPNYSDLFE